MAISEASSGDITELMNIDRQSFKDSWGSGSWNLIIASDTYTVLVAARKYRGERSGPVEGYIVYGNGVYGEGGLVVSSGTGEATACVLSVAVLMDSRGQGIGSRLLQSIPVLGHEDVHAMVVADANKAIGLFRSCGFTCQECSINEEDTVVHMISKKLIPTGREQYDGSQEES